MKAAAFLLVALTGCASVAPRPTVAHAWFGVSAVTDIASSQAAFDRGAAEQNPLMGDDPSVTKMVAFKVVGFAVTAAMVNAIEEQLGRDLTWLQEFLIWLPINAFQTWATFHNHGVCRPACP